MNNLIVTVSEEIILPEPSAEQLAEAERMEEKARKDAAERLRSQQESDTDGFLSQWASGLTSRWNDAQASLLRNGGYSVFRGLFREGRRVKAKLVETKFGMTWLVLDSSDRAAEWVPDSVQGYGSAEEPIRFGPRTKAAKLGYEVGYEAAPAVAEITGSGYGLSGQAWVAVRRIDRGYPEDAVPFDAL